MAKIEIRIDDVAYESITEIEYDERRRPKPMGEYFQPVNLTRGEWIDPGDFDCGYKLGEWTRNGSAVRVYMTKHWSPSDVICLVSDYGCRRRVPLDFDGRWPNVEGTVKLLEGDPAPAECPRFEQLHDHDDEPSWGRKVGP